MVDCVKVLEKCTRSQSVSQFKIYQFSFYTVSFLDFYVNPEFNVYLVLIRK